MEYIPDDKEEQDEIEPLIWYIPGSSEPTVFTIYRIWSNINRGRKDSPE